MTILPLRTYHVPIFWVGPFYTITIQLDRRDTSFSSFINSPLCFPTLLLPSFITPQKTLTPSFTSHKSQKSHSVLSTLMEICSWCDSDAGKISWRRSDSGRDCDPFVSYKLPVNRSSKGHIWRYLWRKIRKEKRRVFDCSNSMRFTYDPHSYSQNFDDRSSIFADEDELSRSFSARFAVPCRIFPKNNLVA